MSLSPTHRADVSTGLVQTTSTDVDEHCAKLGGWRLTYDQISAGAFRGSFTQLSLPQLDVFHEVTSQQVRQHGELGRGCCGLAVRCGGDGPVNVNGSGVTHNVLIVSFDAEIDICTPPGFALRGVTLSVQLIDEIANKLAIELPRDLRHRMRALSAPADVLARFRAALATIDRLYGAEVKLPLSAASREALQDSMLLAITDLLPDARPCDDTRSTATRKRIVDRACDMMLASADQPISLLDVCKAVGASRRKLSYCFQDVLGTSPLAYWRAVRLNRVRRDLKAPHDPRDGIYDIAVRHGFWHFSQFSLDYKRHFAELPSETLRRARMDAPARLRQNSLHH
ncbi:putative transcriptional regulatory protein, AraC family; eutR-like [Bradyrhizobium sp. ORS 285]|uniref:helix-turn-helix domain-containing protein n=1 Tax=Bradyrhizobium sp. ORS 285 TaxID=115808 RepID=UPI000240A003|nr:helix-turn-helix domain-containing protein [Bradyrhizobium sp. ORS 285]CCD86388.1 putative transcriptional regulatory protein, AraC family; eutR-like [Bradyrhizobium sp. ORS 285]SMX61145.1 putative transcriptional regulatory protein, AraC family; eutR-like [Bradyrhizobium sp. ORS 285]